MVVLVIFIQNAPSLHFWKSQAVHSQLNCLRSPSEVCRIYDFLKNSVALEFISQQEIVILSAEIQITIPLF